MEKLKCLVPESIKRMVGESSDEDLASTSSTLLHCLFNLPQFQQMIDDLADSNNSLCGKNKKVTLELKQKGNESYLTAEYASALESYSQALRVAPMDVVDMDKNLVATLFLNRASLFHAWYRRGKANVDLGNFKDVVSDFNNAKSFELSLDGKRHIETELNIILERQKSTSRMAVQENENCFGHYDHIEELPGNTLSLLLESTTSRYSPLDSNPIECFPEHKHECLGVNWPAILPSDIVLAGRILVKSTSQRCSTESNTLCDLHSFGFELPINGVSLSQVVLFSLSLFYNRYRQSDDEAPLACVDLKFAFVDLANAKNLSVVGEWSSVLMLAESIRDRVNSIAIVQMKSVDDPPDQFRKLTSVGDALTSSLEQVPVGQAIYKAASLFNHSCLPNIHAYFLSRTLFIRTTEYVSTSCPLELSYGPQVGQSDCEDRLRYLADKYSFRCQCRGCSQLNLSDLVLNAFCCVNHNCAGVVLESTIINGETRKLNNFPRATEKQKFDSHLQGHKLNIVDINDVASLALKFNNSFLHIHPGFCLHCGSHCDLDASREAINKAWSYIKRLQEAIISKDISGTTLLDASRALVQLFFTLSFLYICFPRHNLIHDCAEDNLAQAFCLVRDFQSAREHCKESIKILQTLYDPDHIVIGYELVKLASIQLSLDDPAAVDSTNL
ncbi:hypothetical protein H0E87_026405 [Populus deltoides]|uniref:SET and MYND domain-containing protein 4 n=1 Tax=Populus deltoides TaxID=3696 RepID=A0A8T2WWW4_POPDE|nr:hypothetical protein H0E87_026405 [Populus deltoides]